MFETFLCAIENGLHKDGTVLNNFQQLLTSLLCEDSICDQLEFGLVCRWDLINLHLTRCIIRWQVTMELGVELLPHFLDEA